MPVYGQGMSMAVSHIANMALLDIPQADEMAKRLTQVGIDFYHIWLQNSGDTHGGGFGHGRKWPILFAGIMLDNKNMKNPPLFRERNIYKFIEDRYTSYGAPTDDYPNGKPIWGVHPDDHGCVRDPNGLEDCLSNYRTCCSVLTWVGQALAAHIMGAEDLWKHDAYFDYVDRWVSEPWIWDSNSHAGTHRRDYYGFGGAFIEDMWEEYRYYSPQKCVD